jgi:hypothetical protein
VNYLNVFLPSDENLNQRMENIAQNCGLCEKELGAIVIQVESFKNKTNELNYALKNHSIIEYCVLSSWKKS